MQEDSLGVVIASMDRLISFLKPPSSSRVKTAIVALYSSESKMIV
jgi:hypothetical protein